MRVDEHLLVEAVDTILLYRVVPWQRISIPGMLFNGR